MIVGRYDSVLGLPGPALLQLLAGVGYSMSEAGLSRLPQFGWSSKQEAFGAKEQNALLRKLRKDKLD
jgi:hypothetical protein